MSVRGSKNKIILYIAGISSIVFVILLYHNASQRLEEMEKLYERCHLNEESLSAQLQVNLEYKVRLEKSLQQEKTEHIQIKEDLMNKLEEERQAREKENLESINKFTALQQKYKFLESQHEDTNVECSKLRELQLSELEEKSRLDTQLQSLKNELKLLKESKEKDIKILKEKNTALESENAILKSEKTRLMTDLNSAEKQKLSQVKLPEKLPLNDSANKPPDELSNIQSPDTENRVSLSSTKSSTAANKAEQEFFPSANVLYLNTSTPMINPDAVMSQDKILRAVPVPQPRQESLQNFRVPDNNENVGAKPEQLSNQRANDDVVVQGVLRAPDIMNVFGHVPAVQRYQEKVRQGVERNNNGGEVGDEGEPVVKNPEEKKKRPWREDEIEGIPFVRHPAGNDLSKNEVYHYQADYDMKKEEGEDDDDVDPLDYQHGNDKNQQQQQQVQQQEEKKVNVDYVRIPMDNKHESVMIQPK